MKTLSRHLAENFSSQYKTRVEPQPDGYQNTLLVETILEDIRNELARAH